MLGVTVLLGAAVLGWSVARLHSAASELQIEEQDLASVELMELELASLQAELPRREARLRALQAGGFFQPADRVAWAEAVVSSADALHPLSYSAAIGAPQWLPLPDQLAQRYEAQGLSAPALQATDFALRVQGLHEDELLRVIEVALSAGGGVTRIEQCRLVRRTDDIGLDVECTLRRFGLGTAPAGADSAALEPAA
jgi:hypothetical protein